MPLILSIFLLTLLLAVLQRSHEVEPQPCPENPIALTASATSQYIHSPYNEDGLYPANTDCMFVLTARSPSNRIQISVLDSEMEEPLFMLCNDYGSFKDGNTSTATEIVRWCGVEFPESFSSANNTLFFHFHSDSIIQKRGLNISFVDYELPGCPPEWLVDPENSFCYKLFTAPSTWLNAQRACNYEQANLLTFSTTEEYEFVTDTFSSSRALPWIGYTDAGSEGRFESVNEDPLWPERFPSFSGQQEDRDCVFLEWGQIQSVGYAVDDCRKRHTFICKKKIDGQTLPIPIAYTLVREGLSTTSSMDYTVLLAMLILLVLLLILIWIGYQQYKKRKQPTQVANLDQNQRFVSGAVTSTSAGAVARPSTSHFTADSVTDGKHSATTSKLNTSSKNKQKPSSLEESDSPRLSMTPNQPGVVTLAANNLAYDKEEELEESMVKKNQSRQHMYEQEGNSTAGLPAVATTKIDMPLRELTTLTTATMQSNAALSHTTTSVSRIRTRRKSFERPHISALDNVSAISMDEFWQKQN